MLISAVLAGDRFLAAAPFFATIVLLAVSPIFQKVVERRQRDTYDAALRSRSAARRATAGDSSLGDDPGDDIPWELYPDTVIAYTGYLLDLLQVRLIVSLPLIGVLFTVGSSRFSAWAVVGVIVALLGEQLYACRLQSLSLEEIVQRRPMFLWYSDVAVAAAVLNVIAGLIAAIGVHE